MNQEEKIDEMYKMMMAREGRDATYRERLDNHLRSHTKVLKLIMWAVGSGALLSGCTLIARVIFGG